MKRQEQVTIKDIAKELGVSISTVSRALADNPLVKLETRKAIQQLAKDKDYQPNFTALSLRQKRTNTIGLLIPQVVHEFFASVINGIDEVASKNGINVIICSSNESLEREKKSAAELGNGRIDGLLACLTKETDSVKHLEEFTKRNIPVVLFDCVSNQLEADKVVINDLEAGYAATTHLIQQGCKTLGFIGGPKNLLTNRNRFDGYKEALKRADLPCYEHLVVHGDNGRYSEGFHIAAQLFSQEVKPDGIFTTTDMLGIAALKQAKLNGMRVPEDVAVIGFSNWEIGAIYEPSLSTVDQRGDEIGKIAMKRLLARINSDIDLSSETFVVHTKVIPRDSSNRRSIH